MARRRTSGKDPSDRGRFSARRKTEAVIRLLRGEDIDTVSRELKVTAATLAGWREEFLAGGQSAVAKYVVIWRQGDGRWRGHVDIWNMEAG